MKLKGMQQMAGQRCHECAPQEWRDIPDVTGDYDMDATILHRPNKDLPNRLQLYVKRSKTYGPVTGYSGYHNYGGDT